jgi:hypothetical protein
MQTRFTEPIVINCLSLTHIFILISHKTLSIINISIFSYSENCMDDHVENKR